MKKKVIHISSVDNTLAERPRYNTRQVWAGEHKSAKYPGRSRRKAEDKKNFNKYL